MSALKDDFATSPEMKGPTRLLKRELSRIQYGPMSKYILIEQTPIGYGGQISGRLLALKLALALDRKAIFRSHDDPPYLQTFEPQYSNAPTVIDWGLAEPFDPLSEQTAEFVRFNYFAAVRRLKPVEDCVENWIHQKTLDRYGLHRDANVDGEVLTWMRLLFPIQSLVDAEQKRLGVSRNTLGVHLRRGDKSVETAYVPASDVNRAISALHRVWPFDSLLLASDSPDADQEIDLPPGVTLIFDRTEKRYNNANHKMLFQNPELAQQETLTALKNLVLLSACGGIVGQDNAHFPLIAASIVTANTHNLGRIVLLNGRIAEIRSPMLAHYYHVKRAFRATVRKCLPQSWLRKQQLRRYFDTA
jgi:hypothetical protein